MFEAIQRNEEKVKWGPSVEKIDLMSRVKTPDGKVIGENLRLDFQTGEVWIRVGCLDTQGEAKSLPPLHDVAAMAGIDLPQFLGRHRADHGRRQGARGRLHQRLRQP